MKKKKILNLCVTALIVCLGIGNCYFIYESSKPNYKILVGSYVSQDLLYAGNVIKSKEDAHRVELALMRANSIDQPEVSSRLPDATLSINDWKNGMQYIFMDIWFDGDKIVFGLGRDAQLGIMYKEVVGSYDQGIKDIIYKYQ